MCLEDVRIAMHSRSQFGTYVPASGVYVFPNNPMRIALVIPGTQNTVQVGYLSADQLQLIYRSLELYFDGISTGIQTIPAVLRRADYGDFLANELRVDIGGQDDARQPYEVYPDSILGPAIMRGNL